MAAQPSLPTSEPSILTQDEAHQRVRDVLAGVTAALIRDFPDLGGFVTVCPERDRNSGRSWRGIGTCVHVSALLASAAPARENLFSRDGVRRTVHKVAEESGLHRYPDAPDGSVVWESERGERLDLLCGPRIVLRAYSSMFLPGSLEPVRTTSPLTVITAAKD